MGLISHVSICFHAFHISTSYRKFRYRFPYRIGIQLWTSWNICNPFLIWLLTMSDHLTCCLNQITRQKWAVSTFNVAKTHNCTEQMVLPILIPSPGIFLLFLLLPLDHAELRIGTLLKNGNCTELVRHTHFCDQIISSYVDARLESFRLQL